MTIETVVVLVDQKRKAIHFCGTKLRSGDLWFPYVANQAYRTIRRIMILNRLVNSEKAVQDIRFLRTCGVTDEYEVTYELPN